MRNPSKPGQSSPDTHQAPDDDGLPGERLQKVLARMGLASRREIEVWIREGRVTLNGQYAKVGDRYQPGDRLTVNGRPLDLD